MMPAIKKVAKQKQAHKDVKKKCPTPAAAGTDGTKDDEGEPSLHVVMANMGVMLNTLAARMEGLEKKRDTQDGTTASHLQYPSRPDAAISPSATSGPLAKQTPAEFHILPDMSEEVRA